MSTTKVWSSGAWVELGGGSGLAVSDLYPSPLLSDGVGAASNRTAVTPIGDAAVAHTPGAWVEVDASLSAAASGVHVQFPQASNNTSNSNNSTILEIGTGAAASETMWAQLVAGHNGPNASFVVPGYIAAGTRVVVRVRSVQLSKSLGALTLSFLPVKGTAPPAPVSIGINTATSRGVAITVPGAINTKGAWTQLTASTSAELNALLVAIQANGDTSMSAGAVLIDIGIGAAASETVLIGDIAYESRSDEQYIQRSPTTYGVNIPAGSRLSARYSTTDTGNLLDLAVIGA